MMVRCTTLAIAMLAVGCRGDAPSIEGSTSGGEAPTGDASGSGPETGSADVTTGSSTGEPRRSSTDDGIEPPPLCGSFDYDAAPIIPGPNDAGFDASLEAKARDFDRLHTALTAWATDASADLAIEQASARATIASFVTGEGEDFEASTGVDPTDVVTSWRKATGAFAGVAAAADAYRYGTLRDQGYPCDQVDGAREQVLRALDGLHRATAITGVAGVVARAYARKDLPGDGARPTTPLFDASGNPLPEVKNNGTWREDESGAYPDYIWEDACSRDQLLGWVMGYAAAWEVIRDDPTIDDSLKSRLQRDAIAMANQLMIVRESGFDLELVDADGRTTQHGYLHERNIDGDYTGILNGSHALMAAGIMAALAQIADDPEIDAHVYGELLSKRRLLQIASDALLIDFGPSTNYSNYNMGFVAAWLAGRYVDDTVMREDLYSAVAKLYDREGSTRPAKETAQSFYDLVYAIVMTEGSAKSSPSEPVDEAAITQALDTLARFPTAPAWDSPRTNCDEAEIEAGTCELENGVVVELLGPVGWNDALVAAEPIAIEIRPASNFYWRSNPYTVNGSGTGSTLASGADFRVAYWIGRWSTRP